MQKERCLIHNIKGVVYCSVCVKQLLQQKDEEIRELKELGDSIVIHSVQLIRETLPLIRHTKVPKDILNKIALCDKYIKELKQPPKEKPVEVTPCHGMIEAKLK